MKLHLIVSSSFKIVLTLQGKTRLCPSIYSCNNVCQSHQNISTICAATNSKELSCNQSLWVERQIVFTRSVCQLDRDPSQQKSHWKYHRFLALDKYQMIELQKGKIFRHLDRARQKSHRKTPKRFLL